MSQLMKAMHMLRVLCDQADVVGEPRVSITFGTPRDRAVFQTEVKRQMEAQNLEFIRTPFDFGEMTIYGIRVRIL